MRRPLALFALFATLLPHSPAAATCGGGGGGGMGGVSSGSLEPEVYRVPWKVLDAGAAAAPGESGLAVLWFPVSRDEARASQLFESRFLTVSIAPCSGMWIVPSDGAALRQKYGVAAEVPLVLLVDPDGVEVARVEAEKGQLRVGGLEKVLRGELDRRRAVAKHARLDEALAREKAGEADAAAGLYQEVYAQRCLLPGSARKAQKALKRIGRPVGDEGAALDTPEPDLSPERSAEMAGLLAAGLRAEFELRIDDARRVYEQAHAADPQDPVATRFLAEFHRHHSGDWQLARQLFSEILARRADKLTRAVALHGLGKMTIHSGEFLRGVGMFEASIAEYPLPLTYRNLAVYWNSEGRFDKAWGYVEQALALAPDDLYNRIFAATYFVGQGNPAEAERVALENEPVLEASYNLAAIWAQLGKKRRRSNSWPGTSTSTSASIRARARDAGGAHDIAFAAYHRDADFVALTQLASSDPD